MDCTVYGNLITIIQGGQQYFHEIYCEIRVGFRKNFVFREIEYRNFVATLQLSVNKRQCQSHARYAVHTTEFPRASPPCLASPGCGYTIRENVLGPKEKLLSNPAQGQPNSPPEDRSGSAIHRRYLPDFTVKCIRTVQASLHSARWQSFPSENLLQTDSCWCSENLLIFTPHLISCEEIKAVGLSLQANSSVRIACTGSDKSVSAHNIYETTVIQQLVNPLTYGMGADWPSFISKANKTKKNS